MPAGKPVKQILRQKKLAPMKRFGQNFLVNPNTAHRIIELAGISAEDTIVELGVGFGALTAALAGQVRQVVGLEIDAGIIRWHKEEKILPANVTLLHQDIMKADFRLLAAETGGRLKIMANLPYSISNPLLFKLVENQSDMEWAVLMLQKEVGQRLVARPGTKAYGVLSVLLASCSSITTLMHVGAGQFHPRPKVDSVVVKLVFFPPPKRVTALPEHDKDLLRRIVNGAFQQRRKTIINGLASYGILGGDKEKIESVLHEAGISPKIRGETLTVEEYVGLARAVAE